MVLGGGFNRREGVGGQFQFFCWCLRCQGQLCVVKKRLLFALSFGETVLRRSSRMPPQEDL
eukprot:6468453-Amphidinium_carterae.1